jgi:hypothetical protein
MVDCHSILFKVVLSRKALYRLHFQSILVNRDSSSTNHVANDSVALYLGVSIANPADDVIAATAFHSVGSPLLPPSRELYAYEWQYNLRV